MNVLRPAAAALLLVSVAASGDEQMNPAPDPTLESAQQEADSPAQAHCVRQTGSRIEPGPNECLPVSGEVITHEEMRRKGATNAAEAIGQVRP